MAFMDENFLLTTPAARRLYHEYAEGLPILDFHCHLPPQELAEDRRFRNMTELWLGGDHYKWRAMRSNGVEERFITGDAEDYEKFLCWAEVLPRLIGNPLYHWTHLELQRYFGVTEPLSPATAPMIWERCNDALRTLTARRCVEQMNVKLIYTTDDPVDSLEHHAALQRENLPFRVLPAWRPDKAVNVEKEGFADYIRALGRAAGFSIRSFEDLKAALAIRMEHFNDLGCRNSDHGLDKIVCTEAASPDAVLKKALRGEPVTEAEADSYKTALLVFLAGEYALRGWVMQLHYGAARNMNSEMFRRLGPDTGFDAIRGDACSGLALGRLLDRIAETAELPKTILYSLNPADNAQIGAILGCFQGPEARGKLQQGCAWWFNDSVKGMREQLTSLASLSVLGNFVGMVTDSRSFLSYPRHEYFRRLLCAVLGAWVEAGEYPADYETLGELVKDISYRNAAAFFED